MFNYFLSSPFLFILFFPFSKLELCVVDILLKFDIFLLVNIAGLDISPRDLALLCQKVLLHASFQMTLLVFINISSMSHVTFFSFSDDPICSSLG